MKTENEKLVDRMKELGIEKLHASVYDPVTLMPSGRGGWVPHVAADVAEELLKSIERVHAGHFLNTKYNYRPGHWVHGVPDWLFNDFARTAMHFRVFNRWLNKKLFGTRSSFAGLG